MIIKTDLAGNGYDIVIEKGALSKVGTYLNLDRRVLIVTDDGVPEEYANKVKGFCRQPIIYTVEQGENSKSIENFEMLCKIMLVNGFDRHDAVVAVGGGVVGDLAGFAASAYMRGIDFYNIPTTVLSSVDSSVGGKTAINIGSVKNIVGAFYQPKKVIIDPDTLKTLPKRQISNGLAEALKMAMCFDAELFEMFESGDPEKDIENVIAMSLRIKADVVSKDEKEKGLRKVLNFGHTIGHGIESTLGFDGGLYHGECVALGILALSSKEMRERLIPIYDKIGLPTSVTCDPEEVYSAIIHDKKSGKGGIDMIYCENIGSFKIRTTPLEDIKNIVWSEYGK